MGGIDERRKSIVLENVFGLISQRRMSKSLGPYGEKDKTRGRNCTRFTCQ